MNHFISPLNIHQGIVMSSAGAPRIFISADYPYYRDDPSNWRQRLEQIKKMNVDVVTAYIPWRHHQPGPHVVPDFSGTTQPNRNVLGFFELCHELNLAVVAKPGPFIHAETNYGGLPNWVCPLNDPRIEIFCDADGNACLWSGGELDESGNRPAGWPLPAPFSPEFARQCQAWLAAVGREVIAPLTSPQGPIVAVQIANEGVYSNGQHAPWAYDYSPSALALYAEFLQAEYHTLQACNARRNTAFTNWQDIPAPRAWKTPQTPAENQTYIDWGKFQAWYMGKLYQTWSAPLQTSLPILINQNPPLDAPYALDAWLTRTEPEAWDSVLYGFTNWVGDVSARPSAFDRYLLAAKRFPGVNMEENWGFAELYDPAYIDAATSFYQTLLILNGGATGYNIYTGVGTGFKDANIELIHKAPYPDAAPITHQGEFTPKAATAQWMSDFFDANGSDFLGCKPVQPVAFGVCLAQARLGAWMTRAGLPAAHGALLENFQREMRAHGVDYGILTLEHASLEDMLAFPHLVIAGGAFMPAAAQEKLAAYAQSGGHLTVLGEIPALDEHFAPCQSLLGWVKSRSLADSGLAAEGPHTPHGAVDVWVRSHPQKDVHFVTILIAANGAPGAKLTLTLGQKTHTVRLDAARSGGAIFKVEHGRLTDCLIKGHNGFLGCSVIPALDFDSQSVGADQPGDFARIGAWTGFLKP